MYEKCNDWSTTSAFEIITMCESDLTKLLNECQISGVPIMLRMFVFELLATKGRDLLFRRSFFRHVVVLDGTSPGDGTSRFACRRDRLGGHFFGQTSRGFGMTLKSAFVSFNNPLHNLRRGLKFGTAQPTTLFFWNYFE